MRFLSRVASVVMLVGLLSGPRASAAGMPDAIAACARYHYREAFELLDALAQASPTPEIWRLRGIALGKMGRWEEATASLERAVAAAPRDVSMLVDLANAQGQLALASGMFGKLSGARKMRTTLEQTAALDPNDLEAHSSLFFFYLTVPGIAGGSREKAEAHLAEIARINPLSGQLAHVELAAADKDYAKAFSLLRELQRTQPSDFRVFYVFGRIAATTGREMDDGLVCLKRCLTLTSPLRLPGLPGVHLRIGDILRQRGDLAAARAAYEESLRVFPEYPSAREALAKLPKP